MAANTLVKGSKAEREILNTANILEFSTISLIEIHIKRGLKKLDVTMPQVRRALKDMEVRILPLTDSHCEAFENLPVHHKDPFDRIIIAQAMAEQIPVLSPDLAFRQYKGLRVIWQ